MQRSIAMALQWHKFECINHMICQRSLSGSSSFVIPVGQATFRSLLALNVSCLSWSRRWLHRRHSKFKCSFIYLWLWKIDCEEPGRILTNHMRVICTGFSFHVLLMICSDCIKHNALESVQGALQDIFRTTTVQRYWR